jgi:hypothetical protein
MEDDDKLDALEMLGTIFMATHERSNPREVRIPTLVILSFFRKIYLRA